MSLLHSNLIAEENENFLIIRGKYEKLHTQKHWKKHRLHDNR